MAAIANINNYLIPRSNVSAATPPNKVQVFVQSHIRAVWSGYFLIFGIKDLIFAYKTWRNKTKQQSLSIVEQKIEQTAKSTLGCVTARGTSNILTGVAETAITLHEYKLTSLQNKLLAIHKFSQISFLLANIFSLIHCVGVIIEAQKLCKKATPQELKILRAIQTSAVLSILGSIGYITAMSVTLFACTLTGYAFIFMSIAFTIGCLKFIYDILEFTPILKPQAAS